MSLQSPLSSSSRENVDFVAFLAVYDKHDQPQLFLKVKNGHWAHKVELRFRVCANAANMRDRSFSMLCFTIVLYFVFRGLALSVPPSIEMISFKIASAVTPRVHTTPRAFVAHPLPIFLNGAWDLNILSQEGFEKKEIVVDITVQTGNANA
jgi:hypothetical protein